MGAEDHSIAEDGRGTRRAPAPTRFISVGEARFAYRLMGDASGGAPPLVLLNRFRGTMDEWDPAFLEALAVHRKLVLFNYQGVSSSIGTVPTTVEGFAETTADLIRALGYEQVDLLAYSMGGYMLQVLALTESAMIRRCVACGSGSFGGPGTVPPEDVFFETALKEHWTSEDKVTLFYGDDPDARQRAAAAEDRIDSQMRLGSEPVASEPQWQAMLSAIGAAADPSNSWFDSVGRVEQPVLILNGDRDRCFPLEHQVLLYRKLPNARLAILPMAGHAAHHQFPRVSATFIHEFLSA